MSHIDGVTINESEYSMPYGKGKIAVLMYVGGADPKTVLDYAVRSYVGNNSYHELIDANLDNPWMRVVISDINGMNQDKFDPSKHHIS